MTRMYAFMKKKHLEKLLFDAAEMIHVLNEKMASQSEEIETWKKLNLESQRQIQQLAIGWRISMDRPEVDITEDVDALIQSVSYSIAQLEEQIVV